MLLKPEEAGLLFHLQRSLMFFVNQRKGVVPGVASLQDYPKLPMESRREVHLAFHEHPELLEAYLEENPEHFPDDALEIVRSWRHRIAGRFLIFRYLKKHTLFLAPNKPHVVYGVLGLTDPLEKLCGPNLPQMVDTILLPFRDKIIHDGILVGYDITFGGGMKRSLNEAYKQAKESFGIITSLPAASCAPPRRQAKRKATRKTTIAADEVQGVLAVIIAMTDQFCRDHLNEEYADLCRQLAQKLARKRPSPLLAGKPTTWACGIVRTIGWVNFLDDRTTQPFMKLTAIDKAFGVAESTGQGKSQAIRKMFRIHNFDHRWTLPSRMDDNPMIWMLELDGFLMDVRNAPREIQEAAFKKGLIPYIPADRPN